MTVTPIPAVGGSRPEASDVVSDLAAQIEPILVDYSASKAAMINLSKSLARTYAPEVRVNVCAGPIWRPLWSREGGFLETIESVYEREGDAAVAALVEDREIPLARMGCPEEVADVVALLASDAGSFTTGASFAVDLGAVRHAY